MRDVKLLIVLVMSLGIIVAGGVAVPVALNLISPTVGDRLSPSLNAAEEKREPLKVPAAVEALSQAYRDVAKRVGPAVVAIGVSQTVNMPSSPFGGNEELFRRFFGGEQGGPGMPGMPGSPRSGRAPRQQKFQRQGLGSGVIIDPDGYILTNNHVVADADTISVKLADGREFKGEVVGTDPPTEIAVIRIKAERLPVAELGDVSKMEVGDLVMAIGSPFGLTKTVTTGIVSAVGRHGVGITDYENFIQTDAAINPGNSGGPLVNMHGQVIGINTAIATRTGGYMGVGFAVPIDLAKQVMEQIRKHGKVTRGWLGVAIQPLTKDMAESMKLKAEEGALVSQVFEDGPAGKAGIKAGDVILSFNGKPVKDPNSLQEAVAWTPPDSKADVVVLRDGKRLTLKVTVEKRADQPELVRAEEGAPFDLKELGMQVGNLSADEAKTLGYKVGQGVLITEVEDGGVAEAAGLRQGMLVLQVAGQKTTTVAELKAAMKGADLAKGVPMLVRLGDSQRFVLLKKR